MKIKNLHIKEFKGLRDISINFEKNDEPLDLVVLAGSNGSGKTRILESVLRYFQYDINYLNYKCLHINQKHYLCLCLSPRYETYCYYFYIALSWGM